MSLFKKYEESLFYNEKEVNEYQKYIEEEYGEIKEIIHEIVSPDIHLDILVVYPNEKDNYYKLITMGLGAYKMNIPREYKRYFKNRAELVMYLPPNWNIKSKDEEDFWPIRELKNFARIPIVENSWIGFGHTTSKDAELNTFAKNTKFSGLLLIDALNLNYENLKFKFKKRGEIKFYHTFPLYKEELETIFNNGLETIIKNFTDDITLIVDDTRKKLI